MIARVLVQVGRSQVVIEQKGVMRAGKLVQRQREREREIVTVAVSVCVCVCVCVCEFECECVDVRTFVGARTRARAGVCVCVCACAILIAKNLIVFQARASCPMHLPDATKLWCIDGREK